MTCRDKNGIVFTSIWVDDSLLVGNTEAVDATIEDLRKEGFVLKVEGALDDYLSCEITILDDNSLGWIRQPHLITKMLNTLDSRVISVNSIPKIITISGDNFPVTSVLLESRFLSLNFLDVR